MYSSRGQFEPQPGRPLIEAVRELPQYHQANAGIVPASGHVFILSEAFQFDYLLTTLATRSERKSQHRKP
jgi:hypothetical protein